MEERENKIVVTSVNTAREDQLLRRRQFTSELSDEEDEDVTIEDSEIHVVKKKKAKCMDQIIEGAIHVHGW